MRGDRNQHFFFDLDAPNRVVTCRQSVLEKVYDWQSSELHMNSHGDSHGDFADLADSA